MRVITMSTSCTVGIGGAHSQEVIAALCTEREYVLTITVHLYTGQILLKVPQNALDSRT